MMNILIHTHGIEDIDYSVMEPDDLYRINKFSRDKKQYVVPCIFLTQDYINQFIRVLQEYSKNRRLLTNILGFGIEGPLLGSFAGVPPRGIWYPNAQQWKKLAGLGKYGLKYIVMGPDNGDLDDDIGGITYREVYDLMYQSGVRIAFGHFQRSNPELSAYRTEAVIEYIRARYGSEQSIILADHLYNDMPRNFKHVWRTPDEQKNRTEEIKYLLSNPWEENELSSLLGPVPAILLKSAAKGKILPFLNFDGDHVDLEICKRTLEYVGAKNIIGITDDISVPTLAGEPLHHKPGNSLWYREDNIVAAGSGTISTQISNMKSIGMSDWEIYQVFSINPGRGVQTIG